MMFLVVSSSLTGKVEQFSPSCTILKHYNITTNATTSKVELKIVQFNKFILSQLCEKSSSYQFILKLVQVCKVSRFSNFFRVPHDVSY